MPIDRIYVYLATACFFGGFVFALQALRGNQSRTPWINLSVMGAGFILQCLFLAERGRAVKQCPVTNTFELLVFVAWCLVLLYFVIGATYRWSLLGLFTAPLAFLLQLMAILAPDPPPPLIGPVHFWNELHKSVSLLSYGAFGLACVAGVMFLSQDHQLKKRRLNTLSFNLPPIHYLHQATRRLILFGFVLLSVGIIAAFLMERANPGHSLAPVYVIWAIYGGMVCYDFTRGMSARKGAIASVLAFVAPLITLWIFAH